MCEYKGRLGVHWKYWLIVMQNILQNLQLFFKRVDATEPPCRVIVIISIFFK